MVEKPPINLLAPLGAWLMHLLTTYGLWRRRAAERRRLAGFSAESLKDLGLSRADIYQETRKPFWKP